MYVLSINKVISKI